MSQHLRYPLLLIALLTLLAAAWAGLLRIGWALPTTSSLAAMHGPLMVSGFLGALIGLERAVALAALGRRWTYREISKRGILGGSAAQNTPFRRFPRPRVGGGVRGGGKNQSKRKSW